MVELIIDVINSFVCILWIILLWFCVFCVSVRFQDVGEGGLEMLCVVLVVLVMLSLCVLVRLSV